MRATALVELAIGEERWSRGSDRAARYGASWARRHSATASAGTSFG